MSEKFEKSKTIGQKEPSEKNRSAHKFSTGAISATIWKNEGVKDGQPTEFSTVTLQRRYNKDGQWQSTSTLRVNDLPKAALVLQKAYEHLVLGKLHDGKEDEAIA